MLRRSITLPTGLTMTLECTPPSRPDTPPQVCGEHPASPSDRTEEPEG
jgi:hypothetical protein